jgi:pyruvate formate lyase activating enzyme
VKVDAEFAEDIHIRIPVIPTVNMNEKNMKDTIKFLSNLKHIKDIELLPYHRLGLETYERLGKVYELKDVEMLKKMVEVIRAENPEAAVKVKGE